MLVRLLIYVVIFALIAYGVRRIMRDWQNRFADLDAEKRRRDLRERERPDVIDLEPDEDGIYRPNKKDDDAK